MAAKTDLRHYITKENGTEPAFQNAYWNNHQQGLYVDPYDGKVLFASIHKYDSGSGWPSFYKAVNYNNIEQRSDHSLGTARIEVRSRSSASHLGHLFTDGPVQSGRRYCINSAALRFVPIEDMAAEGYGDYAPLFTENPHTKDSDLLATAIFAGGCFWCTEAAFEGREGVMKAVNGYTGGSGEAPNYQSVSGGKTGHYEAIMVLYQPQVLDYQSLLDIFWRQIDPTDSSGQFHDRGSQYRTAIFYLTSEQRLLAEQSKARLHAAETFGKKEIVTKILAAKPFYLAEPYHQDYFAKEYRHYQNYVKHSGRKNFLQSVWQRQKNNSAAPQK